MFYNVTIYIASPTIERYSAILSADDYIVILSILDCIVICSTEDRFMIRLFASSIVLNVMPYTFVARICSITIT